MPDEWASEVGEMIRRHREGSWDRTCARCEKPAILLRVANGEEPLCVECSGTWTPATGLRTILADLHETHKAQHRAERAKEAAEARVAELEKALDELRKHGCYPMPYSGPTLSIRGGE